MVSRAAATDRTRQRIIEATVEAHRELGIQATSWDEIARRADVGVGTVYRHFRSLDELLPACGRVVEEVLALPTSADIAALFEGVAAEGARSRLLVQTIFDLYERAAPFIENIRSERVSLPQLEPWHDRIQTTIDALSDEAFSQAHPTSLQRETTRALLDLSTWQAFKSRRLSFDEIVNTVSDLIDVVMRWKGDAGTDEYAAGSDYRLDTPVSRPNR